MQFEWDKWLWGPLGEAMQLSCFVLMIMTLMEYAALKSPARRWQTRAEGRSGWQSVCMGALLGWIPGCVGGFAAVSFYTHGFWRFGAVLAASVTALGDDAFRMWGMMPGLTFEVSLGLTVVGIGLGLLANRIPAMRQWKTRSYEHLQTHAEDLPEGGHTHNHVHNHVHEHEHGPSHKAGETARRMTVWIRLCLIGVLLWYIVGLLLDMPLAHAAGEAVHTHAHAHGGHVHEGGWTEWLFENGLFLLLGLAALVVLCRAKAHFIREHLWGHVVKEHFLSIFLWTLATIYVLLCWEVFVPTDNPEGFWMRPLFWMLLALGIGWIPYSGPHFLFVKLYAASVVPLSVLLVNALVQDGHTSLVLLSESRRQFVWLKGIKSLVAILIGLCGLWWGF